jgi:hypothetical protein
MSAMMCIVLPSKRSAVFVDELRPWLSTLSSGGTSAEWLQSDDVWSVLPPGSSVVWVGADDRVAPVVAMRSRGDEFEVATAHGGRIRLSGDVELRPGAWLFGHDWR